MFFALRSTLSAIFGSPRVPCRHGRLIELPAIVDAVARRHGGNFGRRFWRWVLLCQPTLDLGGSGSNVGRRFGGQWLNVPLRCAWRGEPARFGAATPAGG